MNLIDRDAYRQELEKAAIRNIRAGRPNPIVLMVLRYAIAKLDDAPVVDTIPKEEQDDEIRVGDVITVKGSYDMVVIEVSVYEYDNNSLRYTCVDQQTGKVWYYTDHEDIKKTGKHYILPWAKEERNETI
jgi:hypothetical protein